MKNNGKLVVAILVCFLLISCDSLETTVTHTKDSTHTEQPAPQITPPIQSRDDILSKEYAVAERALNKAVLEKNLPMIRLGLESPILPIKQKVAEVIARMNDATFVPDLIGALQNNQSVMVGGSEIQIQQAALNSALIGDLEILTKIKFNLPDKPSSQNIDEVITKSRDWLAKNPPNE